MKYRFSALWLRAIAWVLAAVCLAGLFFAGGPTFYCLSENYYFDNEPFQRSWRCAQAVRNQIWTIMSQFRQDPDWSHWERTLGETNLRFLIVDEVTGDVLAAYIDGLDMALPDNLAGNRYLREYDSRMSLGDPDTPLEQVYALDHYFGTDAYGNDWSDTTSLRYLTDNIDAYYDEAEGLWLEAPQAETAPVPPDPEILQEPVSYQLLLLLPQELTAYADDPVWQTYELHRTLRLWKEEAAIATAACALVLLVLAAFLLCQAGHRPGNEAIVLSWPDKVPTDLSMLLGLTAGLGAAGCIALVVDMSNSIDLSLTEGAFFLGAIALGFTVCGLVILWALTSFAAKCKAGTFWKSALVCRGCAWAWARVRGLWDLTVRGFRSIPLVPKAALITAGVLLVELFLMFLVAKTGGFGLLLLITYNSLLFCAILWAAAQMKLLQNAAKALADGDLSQSLDTSKFYWDFRRHGEYLGAIGQGIDWAVELRMKSERMKTELITNVSHDIKTPLTSIVNYVDLLQKPHTEAEQTQYLEVLDRQAKRLKRLTENLVEASKASTGNITVSLAPTSVLELINQAVEEYRDRLEATNLEIVTNLRGDLSVMADGKLLWRVLDNLLNNVAKYAMPGTRVYVTAEKHGSWVVIAVKNVSRDALNVAADELQERFVRGDASRHTEGSGLGLNIARSLTQLQKGKFALTVDGDLFKAEVALPVE